MCALRGGRLGGNIDLPNDIRDLDVEAWPFSSVSSNDAVEGSGGGDSEGLFL